MVDTSDEYEVWKYIDADDLWALDKLILARKSGHICGPVGMPVPAPGTYIVRPCVNAMGLGLGTTRTFIQDSTEHLPPGYFWCEEFDGPHVSIDYHWGEAVLCVQGFKPHEEFIRWVRWSKNDTHLRELPENLKSFVYKYEWINCEYIGERLIEVHFRRNPDFDFGNIDFIPVWGNDSGTHKLDLNIWRYVECPDVHGRIGAYVK